MSLLLYNMYIFDFLQDDDTVYVYMYHVVELFLILVVVFQLEQPPPISIVCLPTQTIITGVYIKTHRLPNTVNIYFNRIFTVAHVHNIEHMCHDND